MSGGWSSCSQDFHNPHDPFHLTSFNWNITKCNFEIHMIVVIWRVFLQNCVPASLHSSRLVDLSAKNSRQITVQLRNPHDCYDLASFPSKLRKYPLRQNFLFKSPSAVLDSAIWQVFKIFVLIISAFSF